MTESRALSFSLHMVLILLVSEQVVISQCENHWVQGSDVTGLSSSVHAFAVHDHDLIAGGYFDHAGGNPINRIARWDGSQWHPLGAGTEFFVAAIIDFQGELVAGGQSFGSPYISRWNGTTWESLGTGVNNMVRTLIVYDGKLIAAGDFTSAGGTVARRIASWNGVTWQPLGSGMSGGLGSVMALAIYNQELIAGGFFSTAGGTNVNFISRWDGTNWNTMGSGFSGGQVHSLTVYNGELIAGGDFRIAGGENANRIARWNGTSWQALGSGANDAVLSLAVFDGSLFAGGWLTNAGGNPVSGIARWDGANWHQVDMGLNSAAYALSVYANQLVVGGGFTTAGGYPNAYFARYGPADPLPTITQHPASTAVCQGSTISLQTTATGDGVLTYQWRRNGVDLADDEDTFGTQSPTLAFAHTAASDAGPYECIVKLNDCTQVKSNTATLTVFPTNTADGNVDGHVDGRDIALFVDSFVNFAPVSQPVCAYDLTGEGIVSDADIDPFVARLLSE